MEPAPTLAEELRALARRALPCFSATGKLGPWRDEQIGEFHKASLTYFLAGRIAQFSGNGAGFPVDVNFGKRLIRGISSTSKSHGCPAPQQIRPRGPACCQMAVHGPTKALDGVRRAGG